ncbi:MAG TPA: hypothetical protein PKZ76_08505 [Xanthomonadaceae bacterium]|nr:hypothetical protein [Xanthomonadaceae bacterium]
MAPTPHRPRHAARLVAACAALAFAGNGDAFTIDALWDAGGLQICNSATQIQIHVHAVPIRMSYACLAPSAPLRTCYFRDEPGLLPDLGLLTIKCTTTAYPEDDPQRILLASFEHREQPGF